LAENQVIEQRQDGDDAPMSALHLDSLFREIVATLNALADPQPVEVLFAGYAGLSAFYGNFYWAHYTTL
jgi:hypothetical protein